MNRNSHLPSLLLFASAALWGAPPASAATPFSLFGNADVVQGQRKNEVALLLTSDLIADDPYAGLTYEPNRFLTFADLRVLSATYLILDGGFGGGSMRFSIGVDTDGDGEADGHVFVYLGTAPSFDDPPGEGWEYTGNLVGLPDDELRWDTSQVGGTFYDSHSSALTLIGDAEVLYVDLVVDSGWAFPDGVQSVVIGEVRVHKARYRPRKSKK